MGFTCGFYKFNKSFSTNHLILAQTELEFYNLVEEYLRAKYNNWESGITESFNKIKEAASNFNLSADEVIEAVCEHNPIITNFKNYSYDNEIETWCSDGGFFHEDIIDLLPGKVSYCRVITKDDISKLCKYAIDKFEDNFKLKAVVLNRSFITKQDETGEDYSIYRDTDGIEVLFDNGMKKDIYKVDSNEESELYTSEKYFDSYNYYAMIRLIKCLIKISCETDWDNELVYYEGGW